MRAEKSIDKREVFLFHLEDKLGVALASEGEDSLGAVNVSRLGLSGDGEREHRKSNLRHGRCDGLMAS